VAATEVAPPMSGDLATKPVFDTPQQVEDSDCGLPDLLTKPVFDTPNKLGTPAADSPTCWGIPPGIELPKRLSVENS
jgi:hypothetical protein